MFETHNLNGIEYHDSKTKLFVVYTLYLVVVSSHKNSSFEEQRRVTTVYNSIQQRIPKQVIGQLPLFIDKLIEMLSEENRCH